MTAQLVCILGGWQLYRIDLGSETVLFEMHRYCGPMPVHKKTYEERALGPRHKFWRAVSLWARQGQQFGMTTRKGIRLCIWKDGPLEEPS